MGISLQQVMQECFDGERGRNCAYCPGHHTKNGNCCFGHRFEYNDPPCVSCIHAPYCEPATEQFHAQTAAADRPRRVMINNAQPTAVQPSRSLPVYGQTRPAQSGGPILAHKPTVAQPLPSYEEMGFWQQMGLTAAWGAVEGALELLLGFFRTRRPG